MRKCYIDSETCGLYSMPVLFQYAIDDGPIILYDIWREPIWKTLAMIEEWINYTLVFFNASFDWFQIVKIYNVFRLCPRHWIPQEHILQIALREPEGRDGPALKPIGVMDLMLHARKGEHQSLMPRGNINIRKVPTALAYALAEELEERIQLDGIYFAKKADPNAPRWCVFDRETEGEFDTEFKDVVLRFEPAGGLKFLAEYVLGYQPKFHYEDVEPPKSWYPVELGYAPFALAISDPDKNWELWGWDKKKNIPKLEGQAWPARIQKFIDWWGDQKNAREYANDDILYTRELDKFFGYPEPNDDDSVLAVMVPVVRWRGFKIDVEGMEVLRDKAQKLVEESPINTNRVVEVRDYLKEVMDDEESVIISETTKRATLEAVRAWVVKEDEECTKCLGAGCERCRGSGTLSADLEPCEPDAGNHPAAYRAKELLDVKIAAKEVELYEKLILSGRFHADFTVIGTKSTRMAGTSGLNAQGIKATKEVRCCFPLAWDGFVLCGGDFDAFEVTLADAVYNDPALRAELLKKIDCPFCEKSKKCHKCKGTGQVMGDFGLKKCKACKGSGVCQECDDNCEVRQKIHGLFGMAIFPGHTYAEILASSGTNNDKYFKGKSGVFAMIYGGNADTLVRNLGVLKEVAEAAFENFSKKYPGVGKAREKTFDDFCSMRQPGGMGSEVVWKEPKERITSFLGFSRTFQLENQVCRAIFELAQAPPKEWKKCDVKVWRRDRVQTAGGAVSSALYGAAFGVQQSNMRAAANHEIQSPGGQITKRLQRKIWDLQPVGIGELRVAPINVHDEVLVVTHPDWVEKAANVAIEVVESYRPQVPLIGLTWNLSQDNWAEKKGGSETLKICAEEMK